MASEEEVIINTRLAGTREFLANTQAEADAMLELGAATDEAGAAMSRTSRRGYLMNQTIFTLRRVMYGVTLATIATGAAAVKMGWNYNNAMQQAMVALGPLQSATFNVRQELTELFNFTKYTPFQFKDITTAFRQMYGAMHPLGISAGQVNFYIKSITDALSFAGRTTPGALNRVAVAMQHVAFLGRLTGQAVNQLARDGLPIQAALTKELGLTADQMHNIGKLGIPAMVALNAIARYIETTPGYANAAYRQATHSLSGIFTTFKDNLSQIMGTVEKGFFNRFQGDLVRFNSFLGQVGTDIHHGANLQDVVGLISQRITPGSNGILLFFNTLTSTLRNLWEVASGVVSIMAHSTVLWSSVYAGLLAVQGVSWFLAQNTQLIGLALKVLIPLWITYKVVTMAAAIATNAMTFAEKLNTVATKDMTFAQFLAKIAIGDYAIMSRTAAAATLIYTAAQAAATAGLEALTVRLLALQIVLEANPLILLATAAVVLTAGLVVLYFKWRWFHNEVNGLWHDLIYWSPVVAAALTLAFGPIGAAVTGLLLIIRYWSQVRSAVGWLGRSPSQLVGGAGGGGKFTGGGVLGNWLSSKGVPTWLTGAKKIPGAAMGGTVIAPGLTWVGEQGPELLRLPTASTVSPLRDAVRGVDTQHTILRQPVIIPVYMRKGGKKMGEAYAEIALDAQATS